MAADNDRTLRNVLEKLELLTGERADGNRRAVLISELNGAIQDLSDANAVVKKAVRELTAQFNQSSASIKEEMLVRADENSALAQLITTLKAQVGSNKAQIQETQRALATKTMAMAEHITTLAASVNSNSAGIVEEQRVRVTQDEALAQTITTLTATVNSNNNTLTAAIQNEQTARANADTAEASARQTLTATVNNHTSSITTNSNAIASINGTLQAQWYVQATIDGAPAGSIKLTGIKNKDGSITKNVAIDGDLIVSGTITTNSDGSSPIAQNAVTEGATGSGYGSATCYINAKKAGDVFVIVGSYAGGSTSAANSFGFGGTSSGNMVFSTTSGLTIAQVPIRGMMYNSSITCFNGVCALTNYFITSPTTFVTQFTSSGPGALGFTVTTGLSELTNIAVIRLSK